MEVSKGKYELSDLLGERDRLLNEPGLSLTCEEIREYEEIKILREIVLDIQSPKVTYYTAT